MNFREKITVVLRFLLCLLVLGTWIPAFTPQAAPQTVQGTPRWNLPDGTPHLLAHYVPWYQIHPKPGTREGAWDHWKYTDKGPKHDPEKRRKDGLRDIASVYYPLIGPYDSRSRAVVRYHLQTARAAGIEGLIVDWYGRGSYTDQQIPLLLEEADRLQMRIAICYEEKLNFLWRPIKSRAEAIEEATADLKHVVSRYGGHPAYLRRDGRPVIFNFDGWGEGAIGPKRFLPNEFAQIFRALPEPITYCRQGLTPAYHPTVPGAFQWWSSSARELRAFGEQARQMVNERKLDFFAGMVSPGFDDTGVWGWGDGPRVTPREGLSLLRHTFDLSFTGAPELMQIVTWNDFNEGTVIEPTRETGFQYLDAIATWWAEKQNRSADLAAIRKPFLDYIHNCSVEERAELPPEPYDHYLKSAPLTVKVPNYLDHLAQHHDAH